MNNDLTDEQRARALEMWRAAARADGVSERGLPGGINEGHARYWLAAEAHVLASHTCEPWRPVSFDEIQAGWMIRSRTRSDGLEKGWGVAHHQDDVGDWRTEAEGVLTFEGFGWTYETTAPEPKPDPRVERFAKAMYSAYTDQPWEELSEASRASYLQDGAKGLGIFDALEDGETTHE